MKKTTADYWAPRVTAEWRKSVQGILDVGRQLIAAKEACEHGEFLRLFKGSENAVSDPVPFGVRYGEMLMSVASNPVISNAKNSSYLPNSAYTLYQLTKLDDEQISAGIKAGEITPEMTRAQAAALHADPIERPEAPVHEAMADAVKNAVTKFIGQLTTPAQFAYVLSRLDRLARLISEQQAEVAGAVPASGNASNTVGTSPSATL